MTIPMTLPGSAFANLLVHREEWRNKRYIDPRGFPTIGVGHLLHADDDTTQYWSNAQVQHHLEQDIQLAVRGAALAGRDNGLDHLPEIIERRWRQDEIDPVCWALIDMAFGLGRRGLAAFGGLWKALKRTEMVLTDGSDRAGDEVLYVSPDADPRVETPYLRQVKGRARDNAQMIRTGRFVDFRAQYPDWRWPK